MVRSPLGELASRVHGLKTLLLCASHGGPTMISVLAWPTVLLLVLTASSQAQQTSPVQQTDDVAFHQELEKGKRSISARYDDALQSLRRANEMRDKKCAACYAWMTMLARTRSMLISRTRPMLARTRTTCANGSRSPRRATPKAFTNSSPRVRACENPGTKRNNVSNAEGVG